MLYSVPVPVAFFIRKCPEIARGQILFQLQASVPESLFGNSGHNHPTSIIDELGVNFVRRLDCTQDRWKKHFWETHATVWHGEVFVAGEST